MSCDVICLAMLYVLRCYMSCDVICLAMLYVYIKKNTNHKKTKNKKQKQKKESGENNMYCSLVFPFLPCIFFVTHLFILSLISIKTVMSIKRGKQIFKS